MHRLEGARGAFALAHVACLCLLAHVSPNGAWALLAGIVVALTGALPPQPRGLRTDVLTLARLNAAIVAGFVVLGTLFFLQSQGGGAPLAWFARLISLVGLISVSRTPQRLLGGHALLVALALWNAAACEDSLEPPPLGLGLASAALLLCLRGVLAGHREDIEERSARSITTGVAPTPWGLKQVRLPALLVLAFALVPLGLGLPLPRWPLGGQAPPVAAAKATETFELPPQWEIGFAPEVRADRARGAGLAGDAEIARVHLSPVPPALYLRGAGLSRITDRGFFPPLVLPRPIQASGGHDLDLRVMLLRNQEGTLFVVGREPTFTGVSADRTHHGWRRLGPANYPLSYQVEAKGLPTVSDPDLLQALDRPDLLQLPEEIRDDTGLLDLAERVAWGRSVHARVSNVSRYLQERCTYSIKRDRPAGLRLRQLLTHFLETKRTGVCEEFAATAVVLLRLVDVPARVVTGYRTVERDDQGRFRVRARHAHAWIEVAYKGIGWVPYDPTPPLPGTAQPAPTATQTPAGSVPPKAAPTATPSGNPLVGIGRRLAASLRDSAFLLRVLILFGAGLLIFMTRRSRQTVRREHRARQLGDSEATLPVADLRSRLFALLEKRGFYLDGPETPREFIDSQALAEPDLAEAIDLYLPLRFSGQADPATRKRLLDVLKLLEGRRPR